MSTTEEEIQAWKDKRDKFLSRFNTSMNNRNRCITLPTGDTDECFK